MPKAWDFIKDRFRVGKRYGIGLTMGVACFALSILSFAAMVDSLSEKGTLFRLDLKINAHMIKVADPGLTGFLGTISDLGNIFLVVTVAVIVGVILFIRKNWWRLLALFLAVAIGQAVLNILKVIFQRPRPKTEMYVFSYSFPSGHVFSATVIYGFCVYLTFRFIKNATVKWILVTSLALLILLIGFSRVYLGVHWLSDVLAGYATGFAWLLFCIFFAKTVSDL
ncbi:MAG: phosphatase PAP2 family protein [Syntrophorhabdales bacterium]|jgi:undecaprenyl-diphosphatase